MALMSQQIKQKKTKRKQRPDNANSKMQRIKDATKGDTTTKMVNITIMKKAKETTITIMTKIGKKRKKKIILTPSININSLSQDKDIR